MGLIGKILSFTRVTRNGAKLSDVKVDVGGGEIITAEYSHPANSESFPLVDDYAILEKVPRTGGYIAVSFIETDALQKVTLGEKRLYARSGRDEICQVWLKNDGTVLADNDSGSFELKPTGAIKGLNGNGYFELEVAGDFVANGAKMTTSGDVVTSDGVSLRNHYHTQDNDSDGNAQENTDAPTATE